ncbi:Structural maintenance of chromosomes protein 1, partial [Turnera subulata]
MPSIHSPGRIHRLEMENFKSYKGEQIIGPFKDFTAIIGPNGAGKSNIMDAISFVLGVRTGHLRGTQLKDLIYATTTDSREKEQKGRRAYVRLVYLLANRSELKFTRSISSTGGSEFRIDDRVVNWDEYNERLRSLGILVKARNFLVFQGDVESIASKNPKELTALFEQISGSDELKRQYEDLEEKKAAAEEKSALVYQRKRTTVMERKQKKEQKEEAEKHLRLQDQLVSVLNFGLSRDLCVVLLVLFSSDSVGSYGMNCLSISPFSVQKSLKKDQSLWLLYTMHNDITTLIHELDADKKKRESVMGELEKLNNEVRKRRKEQEKHLKEIMQCEKHISEESIKLDKNQPELLKFNEEMSRINAKIKSTRVELARKIEEKRKHSGELEELQRGIDDLTAKVKDITEKSKGASGEFNIVKESQMNEYFRIKEDAGTKTVKLRDEKEVLDRQQHTDMEAQKNFEENLQQLRNRKQDLDTQEEQMRSRLKKIADDIAKHEDEKKELRLMQDRHRDS